MYQNANKEVETGLDIIKRRTNEEVSKEVEKVCYIFVMNTWMILLVISKINFNT